MSTRYKRLTYFSILSCSQNKTPGRQDLIAPLRRLIVTLSSAVCLQTLESLPTALRFLAFLYYRWNQWPVRSHLRLDLHLWICLSSSPVKAQDVDGLKDIIADTWGPGSCTQTPANWEQFHWSWWKVMFVGGESGPLSFQLLFIPQALAVFWTCSSSQWTQWYCPIGNWTCPEKRTLNERHVQSS